MEPQDLQLNSISVYDDTMVIRDGSSFHRRPTTLDEKPLLTTAAAARPLIVVHEMKARFAVL